MVLANLGPSQRIMSLPLFRNSMPLDDVMGQRRRTRRAKAIRARHSVRAVVPSDQSARTE